MSTRSGFHFLRDPSYGASSAVATCRQCGLVFLQVDWMPWRRAGYCSDLCERHHLKRIPPRKTIALRKAQWFRSGNIEDVEAYESFLREGAPIA